MPDALKPIGPTVRRLSQETAERLIAEAEARGQTEHAEALRRVWCEHESDLVQDLMATNEFLRAENKELRKKLKDG